MKTTTVVIKRPDGTEVQLSTTSLDAEDHQSLYAKAEVLAKA